MADSRASGRFSISLEKSATVAAIALALLAGRADAAAVNVLKTGVGDGVVSATPDCGPVMCGPGVPIVRYIRTAAPVADSVFAGWSGLCSGTSSCTLPSSANGALIARFDLAAPFPTITNFAPDGSGGLGDYLAANTGLNTPARFLSALPEEFKQNWILMSRSESLQTGTARIPRILLPSNDAQVVFSVGAAAHSSYPGAHPNAIEYMQWDPTTKNFRFHEIVVADIPAMGTIGFRSRGVSVNDEKCFSCHSTRNVLNRGSTPGTDGVPPGTIPFKSKPNWDAYDSWGGMLPFNRDRIYQGTLEAAAFRRIFNLWNWAGEDSVRQVIEQLQLQPPHVDPMGPHGIRRSVLDRADAGHIVFGFDALTPLSPGSRPDVAYSFDGRPGAAGTGTSVPFGGRYVTLRTARPDPFPCAPNYLAPCSYNDTYANPGGDEGRGVQLFDLLGGLDGDLNAQRIAHELITHRYATGNAASEIAAPLALAVAKDCLRINVGMNLVEKNPGLTSATTPFAIDLSFFNTRNGLTINQLTEDTRQRAESLPRRKADIQKINFDRSGDVYLGAAENGLIQQYDPASPPDLSLTRLRQEVFRRPTDLGVNDTVTRNYVDRELYSQNTDKMAMFRYFLEPLGVSVDKWSMGVRGRSRTYTFADVFGSYTNAFVRDLQAALGVSTCDAALNDLDTKLSRTPLPPASLPGALPTYTDIQRIFNKSCIECHGGLNYPPYANYGTALDLSEDETAAGTVRRLDRSYGNAAPFMTTDPMTSRIYVRATNGGTLAHPYDPSTTNESCPFGVMPCGGPPLSKTDINTIRRWIEGGQPRTEGDPHLRTVGGVHYDFQAAGEFVLLRGEGFELQARHTPVSTDTPLGPDGHTGLTSCVSVNSAVAMRVGRHRVTYQPQGVGRHNPEGLELRIDGRLQRLVAGEILLPSGGRIVRTPAAGGIRVEAPGGTAVTITPGWWDHYQIWYLNVDTNNVRATEGLMGLIAPHEWLPTLPDGRTLGPRPASLLTRYRQLYEELGEAWRVQDATSLFDYVPGGSTKDFTVKRWPNGESPQTCRVPKSWPAAGLLTKEPQKPLPKEIAAQHCAAVVDKKSRANCVADVMATGESGFAATYLAAQKVRANTRPARPQLVVPKDFATGLPSELVFNWRPTKDRDGDPVTYRHCVWEVEKQFTLNDCVAALPKPAGKARGALPGRTMQLKGGKAYYWKVIAQDAKGAITESEMRRFEVK